MPNDWTNLEYRSKLLPLIQAGGFMFKSVTSVAIAALFITPALGQEQITTTAAPTVVAAPEAAPTPAPLAAGGKIVMFRPGAIMGMGIACPIRYKAQEVVELGRGKFAELPVPAGSYILSNKTASVEVNVNPGQTKFVRCQIKPGFMTGRADLQIVDEEAFNAHQAEFERKDVVVPASLSQGS